jgi:hypothetical protein
MAAWESGIHAASACEARKARASKRYKKLVKGRAAALGKREYGETRKGYLHRE